MIFRMMYIREVCLIRRTLSDFSLRNMSACLFLKTQRNMATALTRATEEADTLNIHLFRK